MACFKCGSTYLIKRIYTFKELAPGSPSRGKKVKWVPVESTQIICKDCGSCEATYRELKK